MNYERIKELEKQAVYYDKDEESWEFDREYFAELIVREMYQVMKVEGEQFSLDQNFDAVKGVGRCMRKIKEHFGVEE